MHDTFITEYFDWKPLEPSKKVKLVNYVLKKLRFWVRLSGPPFTGEMTNVEQRMNMYHLVSQVLAYNVSGDLVELGCHVGHSAALIQKIIDSYGPNRTLHVYDSFEGLPDVKLEDGETPFYAGQLAAEKQVLLENFKLLGLKPPVIHVGWFSDTLPIELPEQISFAHLDGDLYDSILISLEYVYPRLSKGAVCLVDDYCDPEVYDGWNNLPGVKAACDRYLKDKPEKVSVLYAGNYSHGFFRKL
jgi:O-methyltransferase